MRWQKMYDSHASYALEGELAFEQLYARLARWCESALQIVPMPGWLDLVDKCINLMGLMDRCIDVSSHYEIATQVLRLHRFCMLSLIKAKVEPNPDLLVGLPPLLIEIGDIFGAMGRNRDVMTH
jgi:flagellin-specific chaperone FliS